MEDVLDRGSQQEGGGPERAAANSLPDVPARVVRLGMPQLGPNGLSENWLLRECGDRHWHAICDAIGAPSHALVDPDGNRVYASFVATELAGGRLADFHENDPLSFDIDLVRLADCRFFSRQHIFCLGRRPRLCMTMLTSFVKKDVFEDNRSLSRQPVSQLTAGDEAFRQSAAADHLQREYRRLRGAPVPIGSAEYVYTVCPLTDFNGARFLYFANYQAILDRAEWSVAKQPGLEFASTVRRRFFYYGNVNIGDRILVNVSEPRFASDTYAFDAAFVRVSDGYVIARSESVRQRLA